MSDTTCEYVRENYGVTAEIGRRVTIGGRAGIIVADRGHYIGVTFDDEPAGNIHNAHPTSEVEYLDMGKVREPTRSKKRYLQYLKVADLYQNFGHYLKSKKSQP